MSACQYAGELVPAERPYLRLPGAAEQAQPEDALDGLEQRAVVAGQDALRV